MANFIAICGEFVNLDKVCHIQVYACADNTATIEIAYERSVKRILCAGTEDEVRNEVRWAIRQALGAVPTGPVNMPEAT
jgi:hypothetical protein